MADIEIHDSDLASLQSKVVLVTGGSSGIGLATTQILLSLGAKVLVGDVNPCPLPSSPSLSYQHLDVTDWTSQLKYFKKALEVFGRIDHVFANAGFTPFALSDYCVSKHGVLGLMRALTANLAATPSIRVNCINPLWTATGMVPKEVQDMGLVAQPPAMAARSALVCMADTSRRGQAIYSVRGQFKEIDGALLATAMEHMSLQAGDMPQDEESTAKINNRLMLRE